METHGAALFRKHGEKAEVCDQLLLVPLLQGPKPSQRGNPKPSEPLLLSAEGLLADPELA
jgi:hypothetical protein